MEKIYKQQMVDNEPLIELLRKEKATLLPPWGGWVAVLGNPYAPRGLRIPLAIRELGVQHMDIYYAYDEGCPWKYSKEFSYDYGSIADSILYNNGISDVQLTWMTLHTPASQHIRMYKGEVRLFDDKLIKELLEANYLETIPFGNSKTIKPVWDELTRDMVGSLQLDGLSYQEAQHELLTAGVEFERDTELPSYFFRAAGDFREQFCEE